MRKGLYMYRSRVVYERCTPQHVVAFTFADNEVRKTWDDSSMALEALQPPCLTFGGGAAQGARPIPPVELRTATAARSAFMYSRTRFPPPMAQREYVFARRVWHKADDGGCYCVSRACRHPEPPQAGCRSVRVADFSSGFVIRAVPGIYHTEGAVEVVTNYFEDSCCSSGIVNMAIRKALWPMIQKSEEGLRRCVNSLPSLCLEPN